MTQKQIWPKGNQLTWLHLTWRFRTKVLEMNGDEYGQDDEDEPESDEKFR